MRIPEIQALRALAALLVLLFHIDLVSGGYVGVDIFYVISGFLITGLLVKEYEVSHAIELKKFYLRRIKRLLPTSWAVLVITAIVSWIFYPSTMRDELGRDIFAASVYVSNYLFALWQLDYQNLDAIPPVVIHYWSLAVEEQFYLFWPIIVYLALRWGGKRLLFLSVGAISLISFALSLWMTSTSPVWSFYSLPTRAWELGFGALLLAIPKRIRFAQIYPLTGFLLIAFSALIYTDTTAFPGWPALAPILGSALVIVTVRTWPIAIKRVSNSRLIQWIGEISYPLYLWHWPVLIIPRVSLDRELSHAERISAIFLTFILAALTHKFIEEPIRYADIAPKIIMKGAIFGTSLVAIFGLLIYLSSSTQLFSQTGLKIELATVLEKPEIYSDGCHLNTGETNPGKCEYGPRSDRKVVLFGDSHAAQWQPALKEIAILENFTLVSFTKSACPGPAIQKVSTSAFPNSDCNLWRKNVISRIQEMKPYAVIVSGMQYFQIPTGYISRRAWWLEGQRKIYSQLSQSTERLFYISDTPHPMSDIPNCLASQEAEICNETEPSEAIFSPGWREIDPTPWFCADICPAVIGKTVIYRDSSHISVAAARMVIPQLREALSLE